jgi:hypothetical protein
VQRQLHAAANEPRLDTLVSSKNSVIINHKNKKYGAAA